MPEPPESQEGDDEVVQTTVGHMRNALFYYRLTPILIDYAHEVEQIAYREAEKVDVLNGQLQSKQQEVYRWQERTGWMAAAAILFLSTSVLFALR
jgi:hypothetical protein